MQPIECGEERATHARTHTQRGGWMRSAACILERLKQRLHTKTQNKGDVERQVLALRSNGNKNHSKSQPKKKGTPEPWLYSIQVHTHARTIKLAFVHAVVQHSTQYE